MSETPGKRRPTRPGSRFKSTRWVDFAVPVIIGLIGLGLAATMVLLLLSSAGLF